MPMMDKFHALGKRLKFDSHHATERFGIIFAAFVLSGVLVIGGAGASAFNNGVVAVGQTALYTPSFTTSKTNLAGKVTGVYVSEDGTRALVLMQFSGDAASSISADADNYQAFLTGSNVNLGQEQLASDITGDIVVFGTTGYVGVVLDSDVPFAQQILSLTIRSNSELVYAEDQTTKLRADLEGDESFKEYDQWRVYVNPGAGEAMTSASIGNAGEEFSATDAYYGIVVEPLEQEARDELDSQLAEMQVDLAKIDEYTAQMATTQVAGVTIVPPAVPVQIAGDEITGTAPVDGKPSADPLTLTSKWTTPSGYSFDWRDGNVQEGYLEALVPDDMSYVEFLASKNNSDDAETRGAAEGEAPTAPFNVGRLDWKLSDGTDLVNDYRDADQTMKPLLDVMNNLTQAYQNYYDAKVKYQTSGYNELIKLEVELLNVDSGASVNSGDNALLSY